MIETSGATTENQAPKESFFHPARFALGWSGLVLMATFLRPSPSLPQLLGLSFGALELVLWVELLLFRAAGKK